jgi:hypothetical protein
MRLTLVQMPLKMSWNKTPRSECLHQNISESYLVVRAGRRLRVVARLLQDVVDRELVGCQRDDCLHNAKLDLLDGSIEGELRLGKEGSILGASGLVLCVRSELVCGARAFNTLTNAARPDAMTPCVDGHS